MGGERIAVPLQRQATDLQEARTLASKQASKQSLRSRAQKQAEEQERRSTNNRIGKIDEELQRSGGVPLVVEQIGGVRKGD
jgi:hypothetical protein